jgi:hypothetical protein
MIGAGSSAPIVGLFPSAELQLRPACPNIRCVKRRLIKWILVWGAFGLVMPLLLTLGWKVFGWGFGGLQVILWPSSIFLMGLDGPTPRGMLDITEIYSILAAENMILYSLVGSLTSPIVYFATRERKLP